MKAEPPSAVWARAAVGMLGSIAGVDEVAGLEAVVIVPAVGAGRDDEASGLA